MSQPGAQRIPQIKLSHSILSGGNFIQNNQFHNGDLSGFARLLQNAAPNALHDSGHVVDPPKCHQNTRVAIIQTVIDWSSGTTVDEEMNAKPILWLKGGAGAGKSAIARSVAERGYKEGLLLGTFFFGAADPTRNHVGRLVATLSYQLCAILPEFRDAVTTSIEDDPLIFSRSLSTQFTTLLIRPLTIMFANHPGSTQIPRLVIIDGLDECSTNVDSQQDLLFTLQEVTSSTSLIRFLVCSRPESHLNSAFSSPRMATISYKIFLDDDYSAQKDIELYLEDKFREIKEGHPFKHKLPSIWPGADIIWDLVYRSSGQFIYASTVIRYVESPRHRPDQRLDAIFNLRPPFKDLPFTELDTLYRHIISKAEDPSTVLDILAFPILYGLFNITYIEKMLQLEEGDVEVILADLQSLVTIGSWWFCVEVKFLHKSFQDFLCDSQRAGDIYRDLSAVPVQHSTHLISMVSTTFKHNGVQALGDDMAHWLCSAYQLLAPIKQESWRTIHDLNGEKARYVSSEFLQTALEFPTFDLVKKMHTDPARHQSRYGYLWEFLSYYLTLLLSVKDVQESARQIYLQQIRQYCEAVLSLLEDDFSNNWKDHFMYAYYHLLRPHLCQSGSGFLKIRRFLPLWGDSFGDFVHSISSNAYPQCFDNYLIDIIEMSNDLTKGTKQEAIFAFSASFCLAFLCNNQSTARDTRRIFEATGIDQRRRREKPWRWRRMISRRRSLGNQPVIMEFGISRDHPKEWLERLGNIRKAFGDAKICYDSVPCNKIYTIPEFLRINKYSRHPWLQQGIDIHRQPIHIKRYNDPCRMLPAQYRRKQEWPLYMLLLDLLPRILSLSGRYEPLVTMCRTKCLASLSRCWPKNSRRARQAIEAYLQRMDLEENI
ncbi:hypothetical protein D9613_004459 [Agrocybe pediades]|uniref:Nephrocystin 3-like N-terminal domain-containing protein n=1 Tax=Agrocybe pediades TaxID=84607 RepID=A0A8H4QIC7_9AGAR|nr:hypothetical protein D9613_004459 [Agrocybe pediades]